MPKFTEKYRENPFFRSTVNILAVQTVLVLLIVVVLGAAIQYQQSATITVVEARRAAVRQGQVVTPESLNVSLEEIQVDTLGASFLVLVFLAIIFGYIMSRYALAPTRDTLEHQKRFIGNVAHELRTPLSIIRVNTEVAMMDRSLSDYSRSTFATTIEELDRISETINNLLSFNSLLRSGHIQKEHINLSTELSQVVQRHEELANVRGIELSLTVPENLSVFGNNVALGQVFTNLVKNALNYTPQHDGRSVTVKAYEDDEKVSISVIDTGIGIAQKDLYHVFEPFYRGDTSRSRSVGGGTSGLGLAIVNDIVRAHSGSIIIRSALNRGTTIEITFPRTEESLAMASESDDDADEYEARVVGS